LYFIILSWAFAGAIAPNMVAAGWAALSFLLILRTRDRTKILLAFLTMLVLSDSRAAMFEFAASSKVLVVVILFIHVLLSGDTYKTRENQIFRNFLPFIIWAILATLWSINTVAAFQKSLSYSLILFLVPVLFVKAVEDNKKFGIDFIYHLILIFATGLVLYFVAFDFVSIAGRFSGILGNPNGMGIFILVSLPMAFLLWLAYKGEQNMNRQMITLLIVMGASLVLCGSRTALFGIVIFIVFNRLRYFTNFVSLIGFVILVVGYEYFMQQLPQIIMALGLAEFLRIETLLEGSGRNIAWDFAWKKIDDVFFAGGGFGYSEFVFGKHYKELSRMGHQGNAHNSYYTLWLDTGLIGLTLYLFGLLRTVLLCVKASPYTLPIVYAIVFSISYESWLAASLNPFTSFFIMILALLLQMNTIIENQKALKLAPEI
jgi:O-antigen ligase